MLEPRSVRHFSLSGKLRQKGNFLLFEAMQENLSLSPVEIEVPGTVRKHFLPGIVPKDTRTRHIAIYDATVRSCQDGAGNVFLD
jgi:hypothetical protein